MNPWGGKNQTVRQDKHNLPFKAFWNLYCLLSQVLKRGGGKRDLADAVLSSLYPFVNDSFWWFCILPHQARLICRIRRKVSDLRQGLDLMLVSIQECCMAPLLSSNMGVAFIFIVNDLWMLSCIFFYLCFGIFFMWTRDNKSLHS